MKSFWGKALAIVWKDLVSELRTKDILASVFVFALLIILVFSFAFDPASGNVNLVAPGILWVAFSFAGVLGLSRSFILEKEGNCLEGLMLCPVDRDVIYLGKLLGSLVFMLVVEFVVLPIFSALLNLPLFLPRLLLVVVLATIGFVAVGTLFSAMSVSTRAREILLPILFFPVVSPVIIAAVKASAVALSGGAWSDLWPWLQMIIAFDIIFAVVSAFTFEYVLES
ncbi:MAG: heme exporter protein CcmB [Chloroflexi bacterium]|nr:heme exporter protein CcmB [Chloroflexota bacterium]